jgi:hypothetical protein
MHSQTIGTRAQVWHGTAKKTSGGLTKSDLMKNKAGRIVSKAKHNTAKKEMRLVKYGYGTKKGEFGFVKLGSRKRSHKRSHKKSMRGGFGMGPLSPADINANYMIPDVVPQVFSPLDRALVGGRSRSRSRSRRQRGGYYGNSFSPADVGGSGIDGQGITDYSASGSVGVQEAAGMAGGKRRRRRCKSMMGGTGSRGYAPMDLGADDVQMRAGLGN